MNWLKETELNGEVVKLIQLKEEHKQGLLNATADGNLWELWHTTVPSEKSIDSYINFAFSEKAKGTALPFVVINKENNQIIGTTRFCNAEPEHKRLEIGYTWYAKSYQRTKVNTECKLLLLGYAFEVLGCIAVEFRTNWFNLPSREAIARLGAKQDGVLRNHRLNTDGTTRDSVVFSITNNEWSSVKKSLKYKLKQ